MSNSIWVYGKGRLPLTPLTADKIKFFDIGIGTVYTAAFGSKSAMEAFGRAAVARGYETQAMLNRWLETGEREGVYIFPMISARGRSPKDVFTEITQARPEIKAELIEARSLGLDYGDDEKNYPEGTEIAPDVTVGPFPHELARRKAQKLAMG